MRRAVALLCLIGVLVVAPRAPAGLGAELYARDCLSCHGMNGGGEDAAGARGANGVRGAGPSLRSVGTAAVDLYLRAGYMPLDRPTDSPTRSPSPYDERELRALVRFVSGLGQGTPIPHVDPVAGDLARGRLLFGRNCAGCHQELARGGVVPGAVAPALDRSTPTQIAEAIRVGPWLMPRFGPTVLTDDDVNDIARYVLWVRDPPDRGGLGLGHVGPVTEGLVAWIVGGGALLLVALALGRRLR